jgi:hypothetical protein
VFGLFARCSGGPIVRKNYGVIALLRGDHCRIPRRILRGGFLWGVPCAFSQFLWSNELWAENLEPSGASGDGEHLLIRRDEMVGKAGAYMRGRHWLARKRAHGFDDGGLELLLAARCASAKDARVVAGHTGGTVNASIPPLMTDSISATTSKN